MCLIVDTNSLAAVFDEDSANHQDFKPVYDYLYTGKGKLVYGGTKYLKEINKKYIAIIVQFRKAGKAVPVDNKLVDDEHKKVSTMVKHPDFDDQHLVALLRVSGCKIICSNDQRAYPFFTSPTFFKPAKNRPKIYRSKKNKSILQDKNIAPICLPCTVSTNAQKAALKLNK